MKSVIISRSCAALLPWLLAMIAFGEPQAGGANPAASPASAPAATQQGEEFDSTFALHPSSADHESLRIRLLPDAIDQTPGNAAPLYMVAADTPLMDSGKPVDPKTERAIFERAEDISMMAKDRNWPLAEALSILERYSNRLDRVDVAAHCDHADWANSIRDRGAHSMLPYLNQTRRLALLLRYKAQVRCMQSDWTGAERTMQDGFALARHTCSTGPIIQLQVGAGLCDLALSRGVTEWIARPNSPNLYWALSALPMPFVPFQPLDQWNASEVNFSDPQLQQALRGRLPPDQWRAVLRKTIAVSREISSWNNPEEPRDDVEMATNKLVQSALPRARRQLLALGTSEQALAAMSPENIVGRYFLDEYETVASLIVKGFFLPPNQAFDQFELSWREIARRDPDVGGNPFIQMTCHLPPQGEHLGVWSQLRNLREPDEHVALLRTVEAIRDYAARHGGKPPASLDQITDLPLPLEPVTNKPFAYESKGKSIMLRPAQPYSHFSIKLTIDD